MDFDALAPVYRSMEAVTAGGLLQRCRTAFLAETGSVRRALLLGEGTGRFLVELLRANPAVEVVCVDLSQGMIRQARRALQRHGLTATRVRFEQADALTWQAPSADFDLVVSHFFLGCFLPAEVENLVARMAAAATADARWLLADFRVPERGWRRWRARGVLALLYGWFHCLAGMSTWKLTPPDPFLQAAGFRRTGRRLANFGLLHSDLWERGPDIAPPPSQAESRRRFFALS